mmetsp:Transcript_14106/g.29604  ORF Transcript_14106/g.29604 Transcript_14106/m.29604 type:complete len:846 (+) Transcript_14106:1-2538(+)
MRFAAHYSLLFVALCCILSVHAESCNDMGISTSITTIFDSEITQVLFATQDLQVVYVLSDSIVYQSKDGGVTFNSIENQMSNYTGVYFMEKGAADNIVYFLGSDYMSYWFTREGDTFKLHSSDDAYILSLIPHPSDANLVLRSVFDCTPVCSTKLEVSVSQATENSWTLVRDYVYEANWGEGHQLFLISVSDEIIESGESMYNVGIEDRRLFIAEDFSESFDYISPPGLYSFLYTGDVLYAAKYDNQTAHSDIFLLYDPASSSLNDIVQAEFHSNTQVQHVDSDLYVILDNTEGISFLAVCMPNETMTANLFQSDLLNGQYYQSLPYQRTSCDGRNFVGSDFQTIFGMNGVYMANNYNSTKFNTVPRPNMDDYIQSEVTFNKGGTWQHLSVPEDSTCTGCNLHLFSNADGSVVSHILSDAESVGLVIATGNEGIYRGPLGEADVYLSRNGGYSWEYLKEGLQKYAISNHGSLFLTTTMASTSTMSFSWTQGTEWTTCSMYDSLLDIQTLETISESSDNPKFLIIGVVEGSENGFIGIIDFEDATPRVCDGQEDAGSETSDYELFTPETENGCLLGERKSYIRRKQNVECISRTQEYSNPQGSCECQRIDYTCAGNCWQEALSGDGSIICVNACAGEEGDPEAPPTNCTGTYMKPSGYTLVSGDSCVDGLQLDAPIETSCPSNELESSSATPAPIASSSESSSSPIPIPSTNPSPSPSTSNTTTTPGTGGSPDEGMSIFLIIGIIVAIIIIAVIAFIVLIAILYKTNPKVRGLLNTYLPKSMGGGSGDTKLYSVLGNGDGTNSLFMDDDMFVDENIDVPVSSDNTALGSLLDFDDDDAEGAIDIQL